MFTSLLYHKTRKCKTKALRLLPAKSTFCHLQLLFHPRINRLYHLARAKARKKKSQVNETSFDVERKDLFFKQELKCMIFRATLLYHKTRKSKTKSVLFLGALFISQSN